MLIRGSCAAIACCVAVFTFTFPSCVLVPPPCGGAGEACCSTGARCNTGMTCSGGLFGGSCAACGAAGQPCCNSGDSCGATLSCTAGSFGASTCEHCGAAGEPCCAAMCFSGLVCHAPSPGAATMCASCGGAGMPCCAGSACSGGLACNDLGTCGACGTAGATCCAGAMCESPAHCEGATSRAAGTCEVCGAPGEPCCDVGGCGGSGIVECVAGMCEPCGAVREACCAGEQCPTSGACADGVCVGDASTRPPGSTCAPGTCDEPGDFCVPFADAYCSSTCTLDSDCGPNALCSMGNCWAACTPDATACNARGGVCASPLLMPYTQASGGGSSSADVCIPSCYPSSASAPAGVPACPAGTMCDSASGACASGALAPIVLGAPCTGFTDCSGDCIVDSFNGFIGGYCASIARNPGASAFSPGAPLPHSNCPAGGVIVPRPTTSGDAAFCYAECATDCDCRTGYTCNHDPLDAGTPSPNGACLPTECAAAGGACPTGTSCEVSSGSVLYPVCETTVVLPDGGAAPVYDPSAMNTGCSTSDAGTSSDAADGG